MVRLKAIEALVSMPMVVVRSVLSSYLLIMTTYSIGLSGS